MSEFHFGCGRGKVSVREQARINRICKKASEPVTFTAVKLPEGHRYWFSARNYGAPFDGELAKEVMGLVGTVKTTTR